MSEFIYQLVGSVQRQAKVMLERAASLPSNAATSFDEFEGTSLRTCSAVIG